MAQGVAAHRWMMTAVNKPMIRSDFVAAAGEGEVVVSVAGCGVCHTDLGYLYDGVRTNHPLDLTLGHEISGHVVSCGPGAQGWMGKAVIVPAVMPCGECDACRRGRPNICRKQKMPGNDIHGGFASHIVVPTKGLCPVDEKRLAKCGLTLADLSVVADAVTTPFQAVTRAGVAPGSVVIVNGVGGVGGYCAQISKAFGATVIAIDVDPAKLDAIAKHGASLTLNAREFDAKALKAKITDYCKAENLSLSEWIIFECSGTSAGQLTAYSLLTYGATLCVVGFTMDRVEVRLSNLMAFDARALGNWGCPPEMYPGALDLVLDGKINLLDFVEQHPLDQINDVFEQVHAHKIARRAVLVP